jgi:hypothetical protein
MGCADESPCRSARRLVVGPEPGDGSFRTDLEGRPPQSCLICCHGKSEAEGRDAHKSNRETKERMLR